MLRAVFAILTAAVVGSGAAAAAPAEWRIFRDAKLGIEFSYPGDRKAIVGCHASKNCVAVGAPAARPDDYLLAFEVFDGSLDTVAVDQAVFQREGDHWIAKGRNGTYPVELLSGTGWKGLKSVVDCGVSDAAGFHAAAGECLWVVASNGKRSVVADTQGTVAVGQDIMRSILSLRFGDR
jgi:hypothetical protein